MGGYYSGGCLKAYGSDCGWDDGCVGSYLKNQYQKIDRRVYKRLMLWYVLQ